MHRGCGKRLPRGQKRPRLPTCLTFSPRSLLAHSFFLNSSLSPMLVSHLFFLTVIFTLSVFTKSVLCCVVRGKRGGKKRRGGGTFFLGGGPGGQGCRCGNSPR